MAKDKLSDEIFKLCQEWLSLDNALTLCDRLGVEKSAIESIRVRRDYYWDLRKAKETEFVVMESKSATNDPSN